jgi:hypothetical protein
VATVSVRYIVDDIDAAINEIVGGNGGRQILLEDPAGNLGELFEPSARSAR